MFNDFLGIMRPKEGFSFFIALWGHSEAHRGCGQMVQKDTQSPPASETPSKETRAQLTSPLEGFNGPKPFIQFSISSFYPVFFI